MVSVLINIYKFEESNHFVVSKPTAQFQKIYKNLQIKTKYYFTIIPSLITAQLNNKIQPKETQVDVINKPPILTSW